MGVETPLMAFGIFTDAFVQQPPRIVRPVAPEYLQGVYADRRAGQTEYVQWETTHAFAKRPSAQNIHKYTLYAFQCSVTLCDQR